MPNWCDNSMRITNADKTKVDALDAILSDKDNQQVFQHLVPNPTGEWDYGWSVENWGTKWELQVIDWERADDNTIWISFETAWSPPTTLYETITEQGWVVTAYYHEPGMAFCGSFIDGVEDYYEYDISDLESLENIPSDIEDFAGLIDYHHSLKEDGEFDQDNEE